MLAFKKDHLDVCKHCAKSGCNKVKVKVEVQFTLEQATKAQRCNKGIPLLFL